MRSQGGEFARHDGLGVVDEGLGRRVAVENPHDPTSSIQMDVKGTASYWAVVVNGAENPDAAWYYADPKAAAGVGEKI